MPSGPHSDIAGWRREASLPMVPSRVSETYPAYPSFTAPGVEVPALRASSAGRGDAESPCSVGQLIRHLDPLQVAAEGRLGVEGEEARTAPALVTSHNGAARAASTPPTAAAPSCGPAKMTTPGWRRREAGITRRCVTLSRPVAEPHDLSSSRGRRLGTRVGDASRRCRMVPSAISRMWSRSSVLHRPRSRRLRPPRPVCCSLFVASRLRRPAAAVGAQHRPDGGEHSRAATTATACLAMPVAPGHPGTGSAIATAQPGWPSRRLRSGAPTRYGHAVPARLDQHARTCSFPVLVMPPRRVLGPELCSLATSPTYAASWSLPNRVISPSSPRIVMAVTDAAEAAEESRPAHTPHSDDAESLCRMCSSASPRAAGSRRIPGRPAPRRRASGQHRCSRVHVA